MTLANMEIGKTAKVTVVGGTGALRRRLLDMGLTPKTTIQVVKKAPLGDPMILRLRGYELTLRRDDAHQIEVEEVKK